MIFMACLVSALCNPGEELQLVGSEYKCIPCDIDFHQPIDSPSVENECLPCDDGFGTRTTGASECEGDNGSHIYFVIRHSLPPSQNNPKNLVLLLAYF